MTSTNGTTGKTLEQILPRTILKTPLSFPGATPDTHDVVEKLIERDRATYHCFYGPVPFHNHLSHHLLAAYDLGASSALLEAAYEEEVKSAGLVPIFTSDRHKGTVERQPDVLTRENWKSYLGKDKFYANFVLFFGEEVKRLGAKETFEAYVFGDEGTHMLERVVAGAVHPFIQMGYAIEFDSPAMVPQALAQAAVHAPFFPDLFPWNAPNDPVPHPSTTEQPSLFDVLTEAYASGAMDPVMPYNPDITLGESYAAALTPERCERLRAFILRWMPSASATTSPLDPCIDVSSTALAKKLQELAFGATVGFSGAGRHGRAPRLDFFIMHVLTSSVFVPHLVGALRAPRARARLLGTYLGVLFAILLARGSPKLDIKLAMGFSDEPHAPGDEKEVWGEEGLDVKNGETKGGTWARMVPHAIAARDAHTVKAFRSLYVFAQAYGGVRVNDELDGSVFVRAAGVLLDVMGWVGPGGKGRKEGKWDFSGLGWDEAWKEDEREK